MSIRESRLIENTWFFREVNETWSNTYPNLEVKTTSGPSEVLTLGFHKIIAEGDLLIIMSREKENKGIAWRYYPAWGFLGEWVFFLYFAPFFLFGYGGMLHSIAISSNKSMQKGTASIITNREPKWR